MLNVCHFYQALLLLLLFTLLIVANDFDLVNDKTSEQEIYRSLFVSFDLSRYLDSHILQLSLLQKSQAAMKTSWLMMMMTATMGTPKRKAKR